LTTNDDATLSPTEFMEDMVGEHRNRTEALIPCNLEENDVCSIDWSELHELWRKLAWRDLDLSH